jgi:hypothetical protein
MRIDRAPALGIACLGIVVAAAACGGSSRPTSSQGGSSQAEALVTVSPNPESVCSAIVAFVVPGASTAQVVATGGKDHLTTPAITVDAAGQGSIAVLGLAASTSYEFVVDAQVDGKIESTAPVAYTTPPLPAELVGVEMAITAGTGMPSPTGYYLVEGTGDDAFAVDGEGTLRWYRQFDGFTEETKMQTDGTFTTFVGDTMGFQPLLGEYTRYAPDGTRLATYAATSPDASEPGLPVVYTDNHELQITTDTTGADHLHMIAYELLPLSATDTTLAAWHEIQRQSPDGAVEFQWKTWSRFTSNDTTEPIPLPGVYDVDHMNALSLDPSDGNYVASMRDLDAVVKVSAVSGDVLWQIGGKQSTMTVASDPLGGFYGQHHAHILANGDLLLYDNGLQHTPPESRAAEYALDTSSSVATLVWEYRHDPPIFTEIVGSVTRLANGNTLVAFALAGTVDEVDPSGAVVWEGQVELGTTAMTTYRIVPLPSLYAYAAP